MLFEYYLYCYGNSRRDNGMGIPIALIVAMFLLIKKSIRLNATKNH